MTKEQIQARLGLLLTAKQTLTAQLNQTANNIHAHTGAIEDCEYWLAELEKEEASQKELE